MKTKLVLIILIATAMFSSLTAQPGKEKRSGPPGFKAEKALIDLKQKLNLSDEQTAEIKVILFNTERETISLSEKNVDARIKAVEEYKNVMDKTADEISNVLNEKQKVIFEKIIAQRKELPPPPPKR